MSNRILGSFLPQALPKGWSTVARCCCSCHTSIYRTRILLNLNQNHSQRYKKYILTCTHLHSPLQQSGIHRVNIQGTIFKSKYPLHTWPSVSSYQNCQQYRQAVACDFDSVFSNYILTNRFHTVCILHKEESKVEKSVKALKEKVEKTGKEADETAKPTVQVTTGAEPAAPAVKLTIWGRVVAELKHYYHGFRLLFIDMKICTRLLWGVLNGKSLTRRERRQLVRTTSDMFRLVPFLVFVLVPFMEFLLPVAIKLFPNMLPSTFAEENKEQEKLKKQLKLKLQMAKFLQETIHETALQSKKKKGSAAEEFSQFVDKIRREGISPTTEEIMHFAKLFEDEITLDNLSRQQLQAVCRVLNIQPIGIDALLRFQLEMKLRQLEADDKMILKEGIDSLSNAELQSANRARGMRALGVSTERLKSQLQQWLTLHIEKRIPTSLLLLSRALYLPENLSAEEQLKKTITELTQNAPTTATEVKLKAAELAGEIVDNKTRLDVIKHEEDIIAAERNARKLEEEKELARKVQQEREMKEAAAAQSAMDTSQLLRDDALNIVTPKSEVLVDKAKELTGTAEEQKERVKEEEEHITVKDLEEIESALEEIAENKQLNIEKEELKDLKEEVNEYKEDLMDLKEVITLSGSDQDSMVESKAAKLLIKRVDRLISQVDSVMEELHAEKERFQESAASGTKSQEEIEVGEVRLKRSSELKADEKKVEEVMQKISESKNNIVSINEMLLAMRRLQKVPNETKLQRIVEVLDEDKDGQININLALKVLEVLGRENVKLNTNQVTEMLNLLKREIELKEEEKKKEKEEKEEKEQQKQA